MAQVNRPVPAPQGGQGLFRKGTGTESPENSASAAGHLRGEGAGGFQGFNRHRNLGTSGGGKGLQHIGYGSGEQFGIPRFQGRQDLFRIRAADRRRGVPGCENFLCAQRAAGLENEKPVIDAAGPVFQLFPDSLGTGNDKIYAAV